MRKHAGRRKILRAFCRHCSSKRGSLEDVNNFGRYHGRAGQAFFKIGKTGAAD